ncbi:MAG: hypothetical protein U0R81_14420 [Mycobacterium sp.]
MLLARALLAVTGTEAAVLALGYLGALTGTYLAATLSLAGLVSLLIGRLRVNPRPARRGSVSLETLPLVLVGFTALVLAVVAAYYLPVWQWDALGYHLPYVNFALQRGTFADIPADVPYLSSYPHVVENIFVAWRAMLPDDRLVEIGHLLLGLFGALAVGTIARGQGARTGHAVAAGAAWLTVPAVFLQLPSNYVDVGSAALLLTAIAFVLKSPRGSSLLLAGVATGLFLGSKPTAPIAALLLLLVLSVRGRRAGHRGAVAGAWIAALAIGSPGYVINVVRHGNPVWPVRLDLGPVHLPGTHTVTALLQSGAQAPHLDGPLPLRLAQSWTTIWPPFPAFDMRIGGLGLLFLVALPFAIVRVVRTRSVAVWVCLAATLATPDPAVARYVLAFAGLVLAFAVGAVGSLRSGPGRLAVFGLAALFAGQGLLAAYPGLTGEGPPLSAYPHMTDVQRRSAVGADGPPGAFVDLMDSLRPGAVTLFDGTAELPYLAWPHDLSHVAFRIPDDAPADQVRSLVTDPDVEVLMVGDTSAAGTLARADPLFRPAFSCGSTPCTVYIRS